MKINKILFVFIVFGSFSAFSKNNIFAGDCSVTSQKRIINSLDSVIIDLANATITATYIDIAFYAKSDDVINALDYEMQFNLSKLTFSTTIDLIPSDSTLLSFSSFNVNDLFVRYLASTFVGLPNNGTYITKIRFSLTSPCVQISAADFANIGTLLNGITCPHRVTNLNFAQFIPVVSYTTSPLCLNSTVQYSNTTALSNGTVTSWAWKFGNGNVSALQNPATTFTSTGVFTTTLIATTNIGCRDTLITMRTINPLPLATINPAGTTTFCPVNTVTLTAPGNISSYLWSNGATTQTIGVNAAGSYSLQVTDSSGCIAISSSSSILINVLPSDFDKDGVVTINDFLLFSSAYATSCSCPEDLNTDGIVNVDDFLLFVPAFNMSCQ